MVVRLPPTPVQLGSGVKMELPDGSVRRNAQGQAEVVPVRFVNPIVVLDASSGRIGDAAVTGERIACGDQLFQWLDVPEQDANVCAQHD